MGGCLGKPPGQTSAGLGGQGYGAKPYGQQAYGQPGYGAQPGYPAAYGAPQGAYTGYPPQGGMGANLILSEQVKLQGMLLKRIRLSAQDAVPCGLPDCSAV